MKTMSLRPRTAEINWGRTALAAAMVLGFGAFMTEPAFAQSGAGAFTAFQGKLTEQTGNAITVAREILVTGAVLSLIVGLAPMLWGQVKTKWIITALCACVLFGLSAIMVGAFAGSAPTGTMTGQQKS